MNEIEFWFSIGSTYTYLSITRILEIQKKYQVQFIWKPFSVRTIMKEMDNIPFPANKENKVNYMWRDIKRRANFYGFTANTPVTYPLSQFDLANQLAVLGLQEGWGIDYIQLTYRRWFQENMEPAIDPNLSEIFNILKLNPLTTLNKANSNEVIAEYENNTKIARQKKIFGSPTFITDNEVFWGDDRMEDSIKWLKKIQ